MSTSLFCIKEYTIKQGSNWLSFLIQIINQHNGRLFGDLFVVLFGDLYTIYNDVCATYRRLFNDVYLAPLNGVLGVTYRRLLGLATQGSSVTLFIRLTTFDSEVVCHAACQPTLHVYIFYITQ